MGVAASLLLIAAGAVMRFAVSVTTTGFNIHIIGVILMIVGGVGFLTSIAFWTTWGGFGGSSHRRDTTVSGPGGTTTTRIEEREV